MRWMLLMLLLLVAACDVTAPTEAELPKCIPGNIDVYVDCQP